jgi:hypothetical protein
MESKERSNLIQQVKITTEFIDFIIFDKKLTSKNYLYFIEPVEDDDKIQDWEGGLKAIKRTSKMQEKNLNTKLEEI